MWEHFVRTTEAAVHGLSLAGRGATPEQFPMAEKDSEEGKWM